jgi:serine/threonine-protein kinase RsbW
MSINGEQVSDTPVDVHYRGPALASSLPAVRQKLAAWARRAGLPAEEIGDLALACYEAMANVVNHAYGDEAGLLDVQASRPDDQLAVTVTDHGSWQQPPGKSGQVGGGRGLPLIRLLSHTADVVATPQGTTVRMRWLLPANN